MERLKNKKVAILATDGFEESEFTEPKKALEAAGATVHVIAPHNGNIKAWKDGNWSNEYEVNVTLDNADEATYNALVLPGGVINPDKLRREDKAVEFAKAFFSHGKPVAAICHGPQLLIETGAIEGRKMTSFSSVKTDLQNAGANWVDEEVVVDSGLVTSRTPDDLEAFCNKLVEEVGEGVHEEQKTV